MAGAAPDVLIRDVTLRDGLQDEAPIPTEAKLALYDALVAAKLPELELTSFVRPDRVPAMADAEAMVQATGAATPCEVPVRWGLVLNRRGAERALDAGLRHLQFVVSVSERHNQVNAGQSVDGSLAQLAEIVAVGTEQGAVTEVTLSTSFGCPYAGPIAPDEVVRVAERSLAAGVRGIGLADTIGTGTPREVTQLVGAVVSLGGDAALGVHFHDTRGLAVANALAALEAGATRMDGSVGGLGGCPFAPGASGNVALEDLVHALEASGVRTGVDLDQLLEAARLACELTGRTLTTHVGLAGPRFAHLAVEGDDPG